MEKQKRSPEVRGVSRKQFHDLLKKAAQPANKQPPDVKKS